MPRIQSVIFDADGMIIDRTLRFSERFSREFDVPIGKMSGFFEGPFKKCRVGKADLRVELQPYLTLWKWKGTVDELLVYWLEGEGKPNKLFLTELETLRRNGVSCYLATDNEKYRSEHLKYTLGLEKLFDGVFSSADFGTVKSEVAFWEQVFVIVGDHMRKDEVLVWDDDEQNIITAKTFGFNAELYTDFASYKNKMKTLL